MKKSVPSNSQYPQNSAVAPSSRSLRQSGADGGSQSPLTQLARAINQSPRVQAQLKLAGEIQNSAPAAQMALQQKPMEKKKPAQAKSKLEEKKPAQTKLNEKKKPAQGRFVDAGPAQREEAPSANLGQNRTGLPDQLKSGVESLSGLSLDNVKVHYNSGKPAELNALAYAQGSDIHVAPGQERHLPHEAWHIVQQKQGRVQPTMQMKVGVPINDDPRLEHEADAMGAKALQRIAVADAPDALSLQENYGHAEGCACPGCCQAKLEQTPADLSPAVQTTGAGPIQMVCKHCGRKSGHRNDCPRHKNNLKKETKEKKVVHQENQSWTNLKHYRTNWVGDNNITESQVKKFCKETKLKIRGHHSGDNSKGEQGITRDDLDVFKSWYEQKYGWK